MSEKDITLKYLLKLIWRAKYFIVIFTVIAALLGYAFIINATPKYRATMIVAPADGYALGDYASSVQYDRIAALPFWRPKDQEGASTDFYRFTHTLRGPSVAKILMLDKNVLSKINETLKEPIKSEQAFALYLNKTLRIDPLGASPLRKITYHHADADFSAAMLRKLHLVADQMIRRDRRKQSQSRIDYLNEALAKNSNPDHRRGITNLLMQQEHVKMLANLDEAYSAIIVEPASHSPKPVWPNKPLVYFMAVLLGGFMGFMFWLLTCYKDNDKS